MAESQFLSNYIGYFKKKLQKSAGHFSRIFFNISQSTVLDRTDFRGFLSSALGDIGENPQKMARGLL